MKEFFKTFGRIETLFRQRTHIHPARDWFILLGISAVLVGISIAWNMWDYVSVTKAVSETQTPISVSAFDTSSIEGVERAYEARREEAERYQGTYRFVDPSR